MENTLVQSLSELLDTQMEAMHYLQSQLEAGSPDPAFYLIGDVIDGQLMLIRQLGEYNQASAEYKYLEQSATVVSSRLIVLIGQVQSDAAPSDVSDVVQQLLGDLATLKQCLARLSFN